MRINDVEQQLGISKANIRFYEKQGLLSPDRSANGYREYSDKDIERLKTIVILRKLGVSVEDIKGCLSGELTLSAVMERNVSDLEEQLEEVNGSLRLSRQLQKDLECDHGAGLDTQRYWDAVSRQKTPEEEFQDKFPDFLSFMERSYVDRLGIDLAANWKTNLKYVLILFLATALIRTFVFQNGTFWENFFYIPTLLLIVSIVVFPIYWLAKRNAKLGAAAFKILMFLCVAFLVLIAVLLVVLLLNAVFHFWF